jgi:hypothetical protein
VSSLNLIKNLKFEIMIKFIKKIQKAYAIYLVISRLSDMQRTSLYRMLYWKTHYSEIPKNEYHTMIGGGWLVRVDNDGGYTWSDEANRISSLFNGL